MTHLDGVGGIWSFDLDARHLYVLAKDAQSDRKSHLFRVSRCGGAPVRLADLDGLLRSIAIGDLLVYLGDALAPSSTTVTRIAK